MDNYIGRLLDNRYEIMEVIGTGGMAVVYKARCHRLNRLVAIKILKDEFSQDSEFRRRFHAESQAVAMLSHPNIVSVYDVSHSGDTDYIVMELIDGITMKQYMSQKGMLNWREVLHFSTQIAKALEHAHSRGIIHRDIKPHNIMILKDGSVKVADFGIARITSAQSTLTREALGSVHYISPEQARGSRVDNRSDLYSLGVVMYEMLTGRPPFDGESPVAVAIQHINGTPVLPTEINSGIPKGLEQIAMHAMTASIDKRYESATEMLQDLEEFRKNPNITFDFTASVSQHTTIMDPIAGAGAAIIGQERPANNAAERAVSKTGPSRPPKKEEVPAPKKTGNKTAVIAGVIGIALVVLGIAYLLYSNFLKDLFATTPDFTVPSFVGEYYDEGWREKYPQLKFELEYTTSDTMQAGQVISQDPEADAVVKEGSKITLLIATAAKTSQMPSLIGKSQALAEGELKNLEVSVKVTTKTEESETVPEGTVISTDPVAGSTLKDGQAVNLVVSGGKKPELVKVPGFKGMTMEQAQAAATEAGLQIGVANGVKSSEAEGTVIYQSIEQDKEVPKDTKINLNYSIGTGEEKPPEENPDTGNPDGTTPGTNPDNPTEEPGDQPTKHTWTRIFMLPTEPGDVLVTVKLDGALYGESFTVNTSAGSVTIAVESSGTRLVEVSFNGSNVVFSESINFDALP